LVLSVGFRKHQTQEAGAYLVDNAAEAQPVMISITDLEKATGINLYPAISGRVKNKLMKLPEPKAYKERRIRGGLYVKN